MGVNDGKVIGATQILDAGYPESCFNLVLVAEGYRENELGTFAKDADHFVSGLFATQPFNRHKCAINVYRLDVASTQSGANDPMFCGGKGAIPATYFDATFCTNGVRRSLTCNDALVLDVVSAYVPQYHSAQVIINSPIYGGSGGPVGASSTATHKDDGTPTDWREILIHEMGHSIFGLADEYEYLQGCEDDFGQDHWFKGEPAQPNITKSEKATGKWADLINTATLPTTKNADCKKCDPQPSPGSSLIGTFEGAGTFHCGLYRPMFDCKMRHLGVPFCAVCSRVIDEFLTAYDPTHCHTLDPLDLSRWAAIATILFGVIQDGGGVIIVGGKPIPIDPWGPPYQSLWNVLAEPYAARPAMRDAVVGIAFQQLANLVSPGRFRDQIANAAAGLVDKAFGELPVGTIR